MAELGQLTAGDGALLNVSANYFEGVGEVVWLRRVFRGGRVLGISDS